ncbi:Wzz/FepE/Etk N-terminal domain-containing protein [Nocardia terrae]|uniref:Wzz/FepE/Etk N-terminal domain-containing protein n=1 Tax=Nocardia terrae TaxID=2675851 RepID=UPI0012F78522|nr:Wzz/FepE/Etk N-terminal domain-containing protein [Nocardia terrae]
MKLNQFFAQLGRYWATFGIVAGLVAAAGITLAVLHPPRYVSTTQLLVSIEGSTTASAYENDNVVTGRVSTYVALLTTDAVAQRVIDKLGLHESTRDLAGQVSAAVVPPKTAVIDVTVTDSSAERAQRIAQTIGPEFIAYADSVETPTGEDKQKVHTKVVTAASAPGSRLPAIIALSGLGVLTGLLLGLVAVWIRARTDRTIRTSAVATTFGVPVLGAVAAVPAPSEREFIGYRGLRAHLEQLSPAPSVWVITSATGEVDVTTAVRNLSRTVERHGGQPIVLAGDTVDPVQARAEIDPVRTDHTHVLLVAPPVTKSVSASVYGAFADGVILLVALGSTRRRDVREALAQLRAAAVRVAGVAVATTWKHSGEYVETQSN